MTSSNPKTYPAYLENAYEFLDQPSEWYLDTHEGVLYYIPREGEDMSSMVLTLPVGEEMIRVLSPDPEQPVRNITFDNIEFADTGWMRPSKNGGLLFSQSADMRTNAEGVVKHAILFQHARHIDFVNNRLTRLGGSGMVASGGIQHCNVMGNEFFDISGAGLSWGQPITSKYTSGLYYKDVALPATKSLWSAWNQIHNNFFYGCALEYESAALLSIGYPRESSVRYNYFGTSPYSAIHGGWGWTGLHITGGNMRDFDISHNYFSETLNGRLYDGGCIYWVCSSNNDVLVEEEDYCRIYRNYFENVRNGYGAVYPDEGSRGWMVEENVTDLSDVKNWRFNYDTGTKTASQIWWMQVWTDSIRYITSRNNYSTTAKIRDGSKHHTNNLQEAIVYPDANWPAEAQAIIDEAYIQPEYLDNFDKKDGPLSFVAREREYMVGMDETVPLDFKIYGNYQKEYDLKDFDIDYWVADPSLLSVDENGVMTALGQGTTWVVANVNVGGFIQTKSVKVLAGEKIEKLDTNHSVINMVQGHTASLTVNATTTFGNKHAVDDSDLVTFTSADESIASVDSNGKVTGLKNGSTTIKVVANAHNLTLEKDVVINVITIGSEEALTLPYEKPATSFFTESAWSGSATASGAGVTVKGSPTYLSTPMEGKLYAFDLKISPATTWPTLTLCASDRMGTYSNDDTYMFGFKSNHIEVQRFNKGKRTMLFGEDYSPIAGPGIPNPSDKPLYKYNETFSVIIGAIEHPDGTRLVLTINGVNVLDYVDTSEDAIKPGGLFGVYDQFTFAPYSDRTAK